MIHAHLRVSGSGVPASEPSPHLIWIEFGLEGRKFKGLVGRSRNNIDAELMLAIERSNRRIKRGFITS